MHPSLSEFLGHIRDELAFLLRRSANLTYDEFVNDDLFPRAFVRSFEIISGACKHVPDEFRLKYPQFDWRGFAGLRDKAIHHYWGIDYQIVWSALQDEVATGKDWIDFILEQENHDQPPHHPVR